MILPNTLFFVSFNDARQYHHEDQLETIGCAVDMVGDASSGEYRVMRIDMDTIDNMPAQIVDVTDEVEQMIADIEDDGAAEAAAHLTHVRAEGARGLFV